MEGMNLVHYPPEDGATAVLEALRAEVEQLTDGLRRLSDTVRVRLADPFEEAL